jgi:hypothetical protein
VADQAGAMEDVVVFHNHEDGCREHCHQPDSKHFAHLVTGRRVVGFAGYIGLRAGSGYHSAQRIVVLPDAAEVEVDYGRKAIFAQLQVRGFRR